MKQPSILKFIVFFICAFAPVMESNALMNYYDFSRDYCGSADSSYSNTSCMTNYCNNSASGIPSIAINNGTCASMVYSANGYWDFDGVFCCCATCKSGYTLSGCQCVVSGPSCTVGASCGTCKVYNSSCSCVNASNGTSCGSAGSNATCSCSSGSCVGSCSSGGSDSRGSYTYSGSGSCV